MTLILTSGDVAHLEHALATISTPLDHATPESWGSAVMAACAPLFDADHALLGYALDGPFVMQGHGEHARDAVDAYVRDYWQVDPGMTVRRPALGLTIYHRDMVYDRQDLPRTQLFHEWCVPFKMLDKIGIAAEGALSGTPSASLPPLLHFFRDRDGSLGDAGDRLELLRLLKPCFMAAVRTIAQYNAHRKQLIAHFDQMSVGVLVLSPDEQLFRNRALEELIANDTEADGFLAAARKIGMGLQSMTTRDRMGRSRPVASHRSPAAPAVERSSVPWQIHRTARAAYRIHGFLMGPGLFTGDPVAVVTVERITPSPLSADILRMRYRLTPREIDVARHLARGLRNRDIAAALGISYHTARRHTESVLVKLGVSSRGTAGSMVRGEVAY